MIILKSLAIDIVIQWWYHKNIGQNQWARLWLKLAMQACKQVRHFNDIGGIQFLQQGSPGSARLLSKKVTILFSTHVVSMYSIYTYTYCIFYSYVNIYIYTYLKMLYRCKLRLSHAKGHNPGRNPDLLFGPCYWIVDFENAILRSWSLSSSASFERLEEVNKSHTSWRNCWFWVGDHLFVFFHSLSGPCTSPASVMLVSKRKVKPSMCEIPSWGTVFFTITWHATTIANQNSGFWSLAPWNKIRWTVRGRRCIKRETFDTTKQVQNDLDIQVLMTPVLSFEDHGKGPRITIVTCLWAMCDIFFKTCLDCQHFDWFSVIVSIKQMQSQILSCSAVTFSPSLPHKPSGLRVVAPKCWLDQ